MTPNLTYITVVVTTVVMVDADNVVVAGKALPELVLVIVVVA